MGVRSHYDVASGEAFSRGKTSSRQGKWGDEIDPQQCLPLVQCLGLQRCQIEQQCRIMQNPVEPAQLLA